jgi:hypothetical protein
VVVDDHHLQTGGPKAGEVLLDHGPGRDGLAARGLPTGTSECALHMNGKEPEGSDDEKPHREHPAEVGGGPGPESGERAGSVLVC